MTQLTITVKRGRVMPQKNKLGERGKTILRNGKPSSWVSLALILTR
jgi:hypothetical protein